MSAGFLQYFFRWLSGGSVAVIPAGAGTVFQSVVITPEFNSTVTLQQKYSKVILRNVPSKVVVIR